MRKMREFAVAPVVVMLLTAAAGAQFIELREVLPDQDPVVVEADEVAGDAESVPVVDAPDPDVGARLAMLAAEALKNGIKYLNDRANEDDDGWIFPPGRQRQVTGYTDVQARYRQVEVDEPVYEWETYEVYENVRVGGSTDGVTVRQLVKRQRPVKQIGTRKTTRLQHDPNGSVVRTHRQPVYGSGGPDIWLYGMLGHNALSVYVRIAGSGGIEDPAVMRAVEMLYDLCDAFGLPDNTWDLAWMTAAMSSLEGRDSLLYKYSDLARRLASKLADGQIREGPAAGLWGPVSVNRRLLAEIMRTHVALSEEYAAAGLRFRQHQRRADERRRDESLANMAALDKMLMEVAMNGRGLVSSAGNMLHRRRLSHDVIPSIEIFTYPEYIFNQATADIESTALALYALRVAQRHQTLPAETPAPVGPESKPLVRAEPIGTVINRALQTLARAQGPEGSWPACNAHQPVNYFDGIQGLPGLPVQPRSFKPLEQPVTLTSMAQGYGALVQAGTMMGLRQLGVDRMGPFIPVLKAGDAAARQKVKASAGEDFKGEGVGGRVPPYDALAFLGGLPAINDDAEDIDKIVQAWLVDHQNGDGSWVSDGSPPHFFLPANFTAQEKVYPRLPKEMGALDMTQATVFIQAAEGHYNHLKNQSFSFRKGPELATCLALLYLINTAGDTEPRPAANR